MDAGGGGHRPYGRQCYGMDHLGFAVHTNYAPSYRTTADCHYGFRYIPGSRALSRFLVDERALMMVATTIAPLGDLGTLKFQMPVDLLEELLSQIALIEQVAELQDGGLVWHGFPAEINPHEPAYRDRFIQSLFGPRIRKVEPLLETVSMRSMRIRPTCGLAVLAHRIIGSNDHAAVLPGHHLPHVGKKSLATGGLRVGLEGADD